MNNNGNGVGTATLEQYDWTAANVRVVKSLQVQYAAKLMREQGYTRSRAMMMSSDYIAESLMIPHGTGAQLDTWLGSGVSSLQHKASGEQTAMLIDAEPEPRFELVDWIDKPKKDPKLPHAGKWDWLRDALVANREALVSGKRLRFKIDRVEGDVRRRYTACRSVGKNMMRYAAYRELFDGYKFSTKTVDIDDRHSWMYYWLKPVPNSK